MSYNFSVIKRMLALCMLLILCLTAEASAAESSLVLLKFTDDTRFYKIGSAEYLSDLVMEKLFASGKFRIKEARTIDTATEERLYNEEATLERNAKIAVRTKNYDVMFEGEGFHEKKTADLDHAKKGQRLSPELTSAIGKRHGADYLVQGTIISMGTGKMLQEELGQWASVLGNTLNVLGAGRAGSVVGILSGATMEKNMFGVVVALRVVRADTGEVIWDKQALGKSVIKKYSSKNKVVQIGNAVITAEMYTKAMDDAAETIVSALVADTSKWGEMK